MCGINRETEIVIFHIVPEKKNYVAALDLICFNNNLLLVAVVIFILVSVVWYINNSYLLDFC